MLPSHAPGSGLLSRVFSFSELGHSWGGAAGRSWVLSGAKPRGGGGGFGERGKKQRWLGQQGAFEDVQCECPSPPARGHVSGSGLSGG